MQPKSRHLLGFLLLAAAAAAVLWLLSVPDEDDVGIVPVVPPSVAVPEPTPPVDPAQGALAQQPAAQDPERREVPAGTSSILTVVDRVTLQPVAGASVLRLRTGEFIGITDAKGGLHATLTRAEQFAIMADGYLLRSCQAIPRAVDAAPQFVRLEPDAWSFRVKFRFLRAEERLAGGVRVSFTPSEEPLLAEPPSLASAPAEAREAWKDHQVLASLPLVRGMLLQPPQASNVVHDIAYEGTVRFAAGGKWTMKAIAPGGRLALLPLELRDSGTSEVTVQLQPGLWIEGMTRDATSGDPIRAVGVHSSEQLVEATYSDDTGAFRIGPFLPGEVRLRFVHAGHVPQEDMPVTAGATEVQVMLQALPPVEVRGIVRARGSQKPIAGLEVALFDVAGGRAVTTTDTRGEFVVKGRTGPDMQVQLAGEGWVGITELLPKDVPYLEFELWPADPAVRCANGLTSLLSGTVRLPDGTPASAIQVRIVLQGAPRPLDPVRKVLSGGLPPIPVFATTGPDGTFVLETMHTGRAHLFPLDGTSSIQDAIAVDVAPGIRREGLQITARMP